MFLHSNLMQKKFLQNLIVMVVLNLLIKPYSIFFIDAEVQNRVGTSEYGFYFTLLNFSYLFNILLDIGTTNYNVKNIAQFPYLVHRYIGKMISLRLVLFLIYTLTSFFIAFLFGYSQRQLLFVGVLVFNQFLIGFILYLRSYFAGLLSFKIEIFLSVFDRILLILFVSYLFYFPISEGPFQIKWFVLAQTFSYLLSACVALTLLYINVSKPKLSWSSSFNWVILKKSIPYALLILTMMAYTKSDVLLLERLHPYGLRQVGIYAEAYRVIDASYMFIMLFANLLFPMFSALLKRNESVSALLSISVRIAIAFSFVIVSVGVCYSEFLINMIYQANIKEAAEVFNWLICSIVPISVILVLGTLLTANGNLKVLIRISVLGLIFNVFLNVILSPVYGALGTAISSVFTQFLVAVFHVYFTFKYFPVIILPKTIIRYCVFVLLAFGAYFLLDKSTLSELLKVATYIVFICSILFLLGLINVRSVLSQLKVSKDEL